MPDTGSAGFLGQPGFADAVRSVMTDLLALPPAFMDYTVQYNALNGLPIPITQITGFTGFTANVDQVLDNASLTSAVFGDLTTGTVGPQITGLADGKYAIAWAAQVAPSGGGQGQMGVSVNSDDPGTTGASNYFNTGSTYFGVKFTTRSLSNGGSNTVKCVYRNSAGFTVSAQDRSLLVIKYANL